MSGTASGTASGDFAVVTIKIYKGNSTSGIVVQTKSVAVNGSAFSLAASFLPDGSYTVQAEQIDAAGNKGLSAARTFVVKTSTTIAVAPCKL